MGGLMQLHQSFGCQGVDDQIKTNLKVEVYPIDKKALAGMDLDHTDQSRAALLGQTQPRSFDSTE